MAISSPSFRASRTSHSKSFIVPSFGSTFRWPPRLFPIAHGDGNYFIDEDGRKRLEDEERIAFRYCDAHGQVTPEANPNGSVANIAGIYNKQRNVLGMMPHPERLADPALGGSDGRGMFDGLVEALS